jgi:hypothetical protein
MLARGVLPLGTYVATTTNVQLGEAGIHAMDVHHVMPFGLAGEAKTQRKVAGFNDKQDSRGRCALICLMTSSSSSTGTGTASSPAQRQR